MRRLSDPPPEEPDVRSLREYVPLDANEPGPGGRPKPIAEYLKRCHAGPSGRRHAATPAEAHTSAHIVDTAARGRPIFLADDLNVVAAFDLRTLEATRERVPQAVVRTPIPLQFFKVTGTIGRDRLDIAVGTPAVDLLYDLRGFHPSEREGDPAGGTFRWTGSRASPTLPAGGAVTLVVAGARPPGGSPAEIAVSVGEWRDGRRLEGERLVGRRALAGSPQAIRLDLPETGAGSAPSSPPSPPTPQPATRPANASPISSATVSACAIPRSGPGDCASPPASSRLAANVEERLEAPREPGFRGQFRGRELRQGMEREMALGFLNSSAAGPACSRWAWGATPC